MIVGIIQVELSIPWALSLKDKRQVIRSLKDKVRQKFNVSVAEVGANESWRSAIIGMATVGNEPKFVRDSCDTVMRWIEENCEASVEDFEIEII